MIRQLVGPPSGSGGMFAHASDRALKWMIFIGAVGIPANLLVFTKRLYADSDSADIWHVLPALLDLFLILLLTVYLITCIREQRYRRLSGANAAQTGAPR